MNSKKRLLVVIPYFVPAWSYGGPVKVAYDHCVGLIKRGRDVTVLTTDALDAENRIRAKEEVIDGINIIRFRNLSNYLAKFHNLYLPWGMKSWLKKNIRQCDVVHIHDILNFPAWWGMKYAHVNKVKYFLQPHGILSSVRLESKKMFIKQWILKRMKSLFDQASGFLALTKQEKIEIEQFTTNQYVHILPNGINRKEFESIHTIDIRKKYGLRNSTTIFSFLGRIQYIKGLDIAFRLLAEFDKSNKDWVYVIVGPDEGEKASLISLSQELGIEDKIIWCGMKLGDERFGLLKGSDVFLFTSRAEGFPMTILEALGCDLPVYISDGCNFPEVENYNCGILLPITDTAMCTEIIIEKIEMKNTFQLGIKRILGEYDIENSLDTLQNIYK